MNINNRQQYLGILAIVAVGLLAGDRLLFTPLIRSWQERSLRLADLKKSYLKGTQLLDRDRAIREHWDRMRTNTLASDQTLAEGQLFTALNRWKEESRITVTSLSPHWKMNSDDFATFECHVEAAGNLQTLTRFLYEVEKDKGVKLDLVDLKSVDDRGSQLTLGVQVSGLELNPPPMQ
jgi:hypothetical protein